MDEENKEPENSDNVVNKFQEDTKYVLNTDENCLEDVEFEECTEICDNDNYEKPMEVKIFGFSPVDVANVQLCFPLFYRYFLKKWLMNIKTKKKCFKWFFNSSEECILCNCFLEKALWTLLDMQDILRKLDKKCGGNLTWAKLIKGDCVIFSKMRKNFVIKHVNLFLKETPDLQLFHMDLICLSKAFNSVLHIGGKFLR